MKTRKSLDCTLAILTLGSALGGFPAWAGGLRSSQIHLRLGMVQGSLHSPDLDVANPISVPSTLDFEFEWFKNTKASYYFRTLLAYDLSKATTQYSYSAVGLRRYLASTGTVLFAGDGKTEVTAVPRRRYYFGAELGYSQGVVSQFSETLTLSTTMIDGGLNLGTILQLDRSLGIELQAGASYGLGFSAVAAGAITFRLLGGICVGF